MNLNFYLTQQVKLSNPWAGTINIWATGLPMVSGEVHLNIWLDTGFGDGKELVCAEYFLPLPLASSWDLK